MAPPPPITSLMRDDGIGRHWENQRPQDFVTLIDFQVPTLPLFAILSYSR